MVIKTKRRLSAGDITEPRQTRSSSISQLSDRTPKNRKRKLAPKVKAAAKKAREKSPPQVSFSESEDLSGTSGQDDVCVSEEAESDNDVEEEEIEGRSDPSDSLVPAPQAAVIKERVTVSCRFVGKPLPKAEAFSRWPHRYSSGDDEDEGGSYSESVRGRKKPANHGDDGKEKCLYHYTTAEVDKKVYNIGDCIHVNAEAGCDYLGRILEFFESKDKSKWFCCQWFFRVEDTSIGRDLSNVVDHNVKRVFYSDQVDDNPLECIVEKKKVIRIAPPELQFKALNHRVDVGDLVGPGSTFKIRRI